LCLPRQEARTVFPGVQVSYGHREEGCVFCALDGSGRVLLENELALCIADAYPVSEGHSLVIPWRHMADGMALHKTEGTFIVLLLGSECAIWRLDMLSVARSSWIGKCL